MTKFALRGLSEYDDASLIAELKRVASIVPGGKLTRSDFDKLAKVHSSTLHVRFHTWRKALIAAGLVERFDDSTEAWTREEIVGALQTVAQTLGRNHVTKHELAKQTGISDRPIRRLFGSYRAAVEAAGLSQCPGGFRYTDKECYENLATVWMALGRQPSFSEMKFAPSRVGPKAYLSRWGSWRLALEAFVDRANLGTPSTEEQPVLAECRTQATTDTRKRSPRDVPLRLRYKVFIRDHTRCRICGRSIAVHGVNLEVDHIIPWALGGETSIENLRLLCEDCNRGKGKSTDEI
jgi:hypothetical protein